MPSIAFIECSRCGRRLPAAFPPALCPDDSGILLVRYDLDELRRTASRESPALYAAASPASLGMWRYRDVLPAVSPVTLGEGWTPLVQSRRYPGLLIKQEGHNPAGTSAARGLSVTISMARHLGLHHLALASAGASAGALAAYAAAAGMEAHLFLPRDTPTTPYLQAVLADADLTLVNGSAAEGARLLADRVATRREGGTSGGNNPDQPHRDRADPDQPDRDNWCNISSPADPLRIEGEKTVGYELAEQLGWALPDAILCPGSSAGLIAICKAFDEMETLGWIASRTPRPRMYALAPPGSPSTLRREEAIPLPPAAATTVESILGSTGGRTLTIPDDAVLASLRDFARHDGLFLSPEGAAATAAYTDLLAAGEFLPTDRVVLLDPAAALCYTDLLARAVHLRPTRLPTSLPVGGIITPV